MERSAVTQFGGTGIKSRAVPFRMPSSKSLGRIRMMPARSKRTSSSQSVLSMTACGSVGSSDSVSVIGRHPIPCTSGESNTCRQ